MSNKKGKSFITIMIVIAISALFLRIAIDRITKINIAQNESNAQGTLKLISAALENYAKDHSGAYPSHLTELTQTKPPYLDKDYIQAQFKGYNYGCPRLEPAGYSCFASPVRCKLTGSIVYKISTGSFLISEKCESKE